MKKTTVKATAPAEKAEAKVAPVANAGETTETKEDGAVKKRATKNTKE